MGARVLQFAPVSKPITQIVKPKHQWEQYDASGQITAEWRDFFRWAESILNTATQTVGTVALTAQAASIAATTIATTFPERPNVRMLPGLYRVSYMARVTQAATTSSELTIAIRWVAGGVTITRTGTLQNGNTTSTYEQNTYLVRVDSATQVSYIVTYASVGATPMNYSLDVMVESVPEAA